jgi:hypothetical protein
MPPRLRSIVGFGLLIGVTFTGVAPTLGAPGDRSDARCQEELEVLANLMKDGPGARLAIETLGRVAQCEAVKAAIKALGTPPIPGLDQKEADKRGGAEAGKEEARTSTRDPAGRQVGEEPGDKKATGQRAAKPDGQFPVTTDKDDADKRRAAEEAERRKSEEADKRRDAADARRAKERDKEAARKKADARKVEVRRKSSDETASTRGPMTRARCTAMVKAKYGYIYAVVDWETKISQCISTGGSNY